MWYNGGMKLGKTWSQLGKRMRIAVVAVMLLMVGFMVAFETQKQGFHEDEAYTITSSVSPVWQGIMTTSDEEGVPLVKTKEDYEGYVYFQHFDPALVYLNQASDVHPPLYYLLFHGIAAIFQKGTFQVAFAINLVFFVLTLWTVVKICVLLKRPKAILPALIMLSFSILGINMVTFQRMYAMMTFFVVLTLYYNLRIYRQDFVMKKADKVGLAVSIVLGFLTQYYYVVYLVVMFAMMVVKMWRTKKTESLKAYVGIHVGMGVLGVALYPMSLWHIFASYRGVGAMAAAEQNLGEKLLAWLEVMRVNVYVPILMLVGMVGFLVWRWRKGEVGGWGLLVVPALVYLVIVMFLSPYTDIRYLMPGLTVAVVAVALMVGEFLSGGVMIGGAIGVVVLGALLYRPSFLYEDYRVAIEQAEENAGKTMIYVTDNNFTFVKNLPEYIRYDKSIIVKDNYDEIEKLELEEGEYVVRMDEYMDKEGILKKLEERGLKVVEEPELDFSGVLILGEV